MAWFKKIAEPKTRSSRTAQNGQVRFFEGFKLEPNAKKIQRSETHDKVSIEGLDDEVDDTRIVIVKKTLNDHAFRPK